MCGRFYVPTGETEYFRQVLDDLKERGIGVKTGEVNPGDVAAVLANNRRLVPTAFGMKWGYRLANGKLVFNTRSETASEKPLFQDGFAQRRCLIPAAHYFEWQQGDKGKTKFAIAPPDAEGLLLAGIYRLEQGQAVFSVLTRSPAEAVAEIHDRMPVILPQEVAGDWLNPKYKAEEVLRSAVLDLVSRPVQHA